MTKVSVIVPVYKVEKYIENCIKSLINQTLKDIEIILVDDGSPDQCPIICDKYAKKDSRIRVIHKSNEGVSAARNDGLKVAIGDYIIFCDSDDWMDISGLELLYNRAVSENADISIGDVYMAKKIENKYVKFYNKEFVTEDLGLISELIKCDIYRTYCPLPPEEGIAFGYGGPWNKLVKRQMLIENCIEFDIRVKGIFDDILYTAYILSHAKKVVYSQKAVYYYRIIEGSMTHTYKPNVIEINDAIFNSWQEFFNSQVDANFYQKAYYACVMRRLEEGIKLYFLNSENNKNKKILKQELKELVAREPYYEAVRNVDWKKISKKQKLLSFLSKLNLTELIFMIKMF